MKNNRNNKSINRFFQLFTVVIFVSFIIVFGILFLIFPKKTHSEIEKRDLTKFPEFSLKSLADGSFTDNITKYVSDNFVFRENLVDFSRSLEENRGIEYDGIKSYSNGNDNNSIENLFVDKPLKKVKVSVFDNETVKLGEEFKSSINFEDVLENTEVYEELDEEEIKGQKVGSLYVIKDTALEIFYGNSNIAQDYVNIINTYRVAVPSNVNIYNLIIPTHFEFALPDKYKTEVGKPEKPYIDEIYASLNPSVIPVDAYSNIKEHYEKGEYLYFRSDHHWTALGAYRAYEAFANKAGFAPTPLSSFEERNVEKFLGTFYSSTFNEELKNNPDYVKYYAPLNNYTVTNYFEEDGVITSKSGFLVAKNVSGDSNGYLVFLGGDIPLSVIETDANTGRSIIIFKESYGNAFVPFLAQNFDKIYVADIRTFPYNAVDYVVNQNITDVLFINNIMTSCSPPRIKNYLDLMQK